LISRAFYWTNLTLAFLLELCALAALGYWGFRVGGGPVTKLVAGLGAPLVAAGLWGLFAAPRAPVSVPLARLAVQLVVFGSAAVALYAKAHAALALTFAILVTVNSVTVRLGGTPQPQAKQ
jgi:Protein of unknown function (DUF2568)